MSDLPRIRTMLAAQGGRATITISTPRDEHATFRIKRKDTGKWAGRTFIDVPDEREQYGWRSVGTLAADGSFTPYSGCSSVLAYAIRLTLACLAADTDPATTRGGPYVIQAADQCGMCGRKLTHPDSIPVGIGPECAQKAGAFHPGYTSSHVRTRA